MGVTCRGRAWQGCVHNRFSRFCQQQCLLVPLARACVQVHSRVHDEEHADVGFRTREFVGNVHNEVGCAPLVCVAV